MLSLSRTEFKVMEYIFEKCQGEQQVLLTPKELLAALMPRTEITVKQLDVIMKNLVLDDYIECQQGTKNGIPYFVVSLTMRGAAFDRERENTRRARRNALMWKVAFAVLAGVVTVIVTKVLMSIW